MKWYNEMPTVYEEELVRSLVASFGVEMTISYELNDGILGCASVTSNKITVYLSALTDYRRFLTVTFHELSHILEGQKGNFALYHSGRGNLNKKERLQLIRTALKAERFVDKKAKEMMKCFFPEVPYRKAYRNKESVKWLKSEFLQPYR